MQKLTWREALRAALPFYLALISVWFLLGVAFVPAAPFYVFVLLVASFIGMFAFQTFLSKTGMRKCASCGKIMGILQVVEGTCSECVSRQRKEGKA